MIRTGADSSINQSVGLSRGCRRSSQDGHHEATEVKPRGGPRVTSKVSISTARQFCQSHSTNRYSEIHLLPHQCPLPHSLSTPGPTLHLLILGLVFFCFS
ncbi:unnamed protein product [Protopolystoma xenopodis]|uniref:Uncharacterized protein n=1 Tax=Protopolystoma xenopodis TaxID=117903 RepID=A0A448XAF1_9PLAT|nr:unnamed protein product [Protopolystoma xenopodis]